MKKKTLWIAETAVMIALLVALQGLTKPAGQFVTGSCVNLILGVSTLVGGLWCGLTVALLSPFFAFLFGIGPALIQIVPAIAVGNIVLVLVLFSLCRKAKKLSPLSYGGAVAASVCKFAVLYALVVLLLLPLLPKAEAVAAPEDQILLFMETNGLSNENFSLSYYNIATGESYSFNPDAMLPAGSLWLLPLHMYYCEQESLGVFEPDVTKLEEAYTIGGYTLAESRYRTLLLEDSALAQTMQNQLGGYSAYKQKVNEAFGHLPQETLTETFLSDNCFSARFWMACLQELTLHPEIYQDLLRNYSLIQTKDGLAGGAVRYSMLQFRGEEDGYTTALGQINASMPFLLVCSVPSKESNALLAQLCDIFCQYTEESEIPAQETIPEREPSVDMAVSTLPQQQMRELFRWVGIALGAALLLALLIAIPIRLRRRRDTID